MDTRDYSSIHPNLLIEIPIFFSIQNNTKGNVKDKSIYEFCEYFKKKYQLTELPQPRQISKICDILCENGKLSNTFKGGIDGLENKYIGTIKKDALSDKNNQYLLSKLLHYLVFGFRYIRKK